MLRYDTIGARRMTLRYVLLYKLFMDILPANVTYHLAIEFLVFSRLLTVFIQKITFFLCPKAYFMYENSNYAIH